MIILVTLFEMCLMIVSGTICFGIILLLKLHYKLTKYDFTTYEYILYSEGRKERLKRLKKKYITQEQFETIEKKALNREIKKRSKIIKEVNEENEQKIFQKILKKKRQMEMGDEESKINKIHNNSNSKIKVNFIKYL